MSISIHLPSGEEIVLNQNTATIGSALSCDVIVPPGGEIQPTHLKISRMMNRWMVETAGDWLVQVDDTVPARKGWLKSGSVIRISASGPDLRFEERSGETSSTTPSPKQHPPTQTPPTKAPAPRAGSPVSIPKPPPAKPQTPKTPPQPPQEDFLIPLDEEDLAMAFLEGKDVPSPPQRPVSPPKAPPARAVPPRSETPKARKQSPTPPSQSSGQQASSPKARPIPSPPGVTPIPPGKNPSKESTAASGSPQNAPLASEPKCHYCGVALSPIGQCPKCGRQFRRVKKAPN